jgi:hypothetical protein
MTRISAARYYLVARWLVQPHPPLDCSNVPVPDLLPPSHPQALVFRHRWQAACGNLEEMPLGVGLGQPPAVDQVEVEAPVSVQQVLFALGQGWHAIGFAG